MTAGILVGLPACGDVAPVVDAGVAMARVRRSRVSLVAIPWVPPFIVGWAAPIAPPWSPESLRQAGVDCALRLCRDTATGMPDDVSVAYAVVPGRPRRVVPTLLATGRFSAAVMPGGWRRSHRLRRLAEEIEVQWV